MCTFSLILLLISEIKPFPFPVFVAEIIALRKQRYKEIHSRLRSPVKWAPRAIGQVRKEKALRTKQEKKHIEHAPPYRWHHFYTQRIHKKFGG